MEARTAERVRTVASVTKEVQGIFASQGLTTTVGDVLPISLGIAKDIQEEEDAREPVTADSG